jgi:pseudouridine kinase
MFFEKILCKCCNSQINSQFCVKDKKYYYCDFCKSVFLSEEFLLSEENQLDRYLLHNNTLEDNGYKTYLEKFFEEVLSATKEKNHTYLDYGSGPNPCLVELVKQKYCDFEVIEGWDLFFTKDFTPKENFYSLITCLEVAEHFENPIESFKHIYSLLKTGGILAVQTQIFYSEDDFEKTSKKFATWWYKEDTTHVTFYSKEGLITCCKNAGLEFIQQVDKNLLIFTKKD